MVKRRKVIGQQRQTAVRDEQLAVMERVQHLGEARTKLRTYEPIKPMNWPYGHVGIREADNDVEECFMITIHGVQHYLHATTAYELYKMMGTAITKWDAYAKSYGMPGVL